MHNILHLQLQKNIAKAWKIWQKFAFISKNLYKIDRKNKLAFTKLQ